jgi:hypothetical protein
MAWGIASVVFVTGAGVVFVLLHLLPTGVRPAVDPVGDYGLTGYRSRYRVMVVRLGVGGSLLAGGLATCTDAGGVVWLWVFAASRVAIAGFTAARDAWSDSTRERVHVLLSVTAYASIALTAAVVTWTDAPSILRAAGYVVVAAALAALATIVVRPLRGFIGLGDRALYIASGLWLLIAATGLAGGY